MIASKLITFKHVVCRFIKLEVCLASHTASEWKNKIYEAFSGCVAITAHYCCIQIQWTLAPICVIVNGTKQLRNIRIECRRLAQFKTKENELL